MSPPLSYMQLKRIDRAVTVGEKSNKKEMLSISCLVVSACALDHP
jgi:hypothetical protein